jgi:hypothetical protein
MAGEFHCPRPHRTPAYILVEANHCNAQFKGDGG